MNAYDVIHQNMKMLKNMEGWIDKAAQHADAKKFPVDTLVKARLAPDQYAFDRQVQSACDSAKFLAAYLTGTEAPAHPDTEQTMAELRARIRSCMSYLEGVTKESLEGADTRKVSPKWAKGGSTTGAEFTLQAGLPNFYFHATTAYAILRHNGVDLGKLDFMGAMPFKP
jgi:hypothetical protein